MQASLPSPERHSSKWHRYWELLLFKTYTDLKIEKQMTYLGFLWWALEPMLFLTIYYFIFGIILKTRTAHFTEFLFVGVVAWRWFGPTMTRSSRAIKSETKLMREIYVSKLLFPATHVLNDGIKFIIIFSLLLLFLSLFYHHPTLLWLTIIPNFFCQMGLIIGLSFCFSAITPFIPDFPLVVQTGMIAMTILSGVFFDVLAAPSHWQDILLLNPLADILINYRLPLIYNKAPLWNYMLYSFGFGLLLNIIGIIAIRKNERVFPKVCT
jgi:lipopolysaccharide transport system permease protein